MVWRVELFKKNKPISAESGLVKSQVSANDRFERKTTEDVFMYELKLFTTVKGEKVKKTERWKILSNGACCFFP